jgi:hypothetical protein
MMMLKQSVESNPSKEQFPHEISIEPIVTTPQKSKYKKEESPFSQRRSFKKNS